MIFSQGDGYYGQWAEGVIQGKGLYISRNGNSYKGVFIQGKPDGEGVLRTWNIQENKIENEIRGAWDKGEWKPTTEE